MEQRSLFGLSEHLEKLSKHGDPLEVLAATVDFEFFRSWLVEGLGYGDGLKGGRPPFDPVSMFKALILQAQHNLSDAKMEFMIRDRLSWLRFLGFDLGGPTPDENTIRHFRNKLSETGTLKRVMKAFDWQLHKKGYIPMSGHRRCQLVPAPKQCNTMARTRRSRLVNRLRRSGRTSRNARRRTSTPVDPKIARCAIALTHAAADRRPRIQIHISIDRGFGFIRESAVTAASAADGPMMRQLVSTANTGGEVWADSAYRSRRNEKWLARKMLISRIHRRKPAGKPMPQATARANARKSAIRARMEHVFAHQKGRFGLFIRSIGLVRAEAKLTLANIAYNFDRLIFHERCKTTG
jgi:IS5 family transposase